MPPEPRDETIRTRMRRQGRRDTRPEVLIRRRLHSLGYRFRVDHKPDPDLRCRGDIVFTRQRVVVFVNGCFWHACPEHGTLPKNNAEWWREKFEANTERDRRTDEALAARGWRVLRLWEHASIDEAVQEVIDALVNSGKRP